MSSASMGSCTLSLSLILLLMWTRSSMTFFLTASRPDPSLARHPGRWRWRADCRAASLSAEARRNRMLSRAVTSSDSLGVEVGEEAMMEGG